MKVLVNKKTGHIYYYKGPGDYHCKEGIIKEEDINTKNLVISTLRKEFYVFEANKFDYYNKIKRGPQILIPKDIGYIIARTGIDKNSVVVEAGGGSGGITSYFSRICKEVHTYELEEANCKIIEKNIEYLGLDNVNLINGNLKDYIVKEENVDLLFLDMPNPIEVLEENVRCVKLGCYIVCYLPSISQISELDKWIYENISDSLYIEEISEVSVRNWKVKGFISRPEHKKEIDHTAFLVFIRVY